MNDVISRQQAIETFKDCAVNGVGIDGIVDALKQLPSTEPKRIKGKWITDKQGYVTWSAICNKCGARTQMFDGYYNFCPHCGAKMEVNHESN